MDFARQMTSGERRALAIENEKGEPAEVAAVLDTEPVDMGFEMEHKEFEIRDMTFAIVCMVFEKVCTAFEKVYMAFGIAGRGSWARRAASDSIDKAFVKGHMEPGQREKKFVVVVGHIAVEKRGTLLGAVVAGKWDVFGDGVVVAVSLTVDIYSAVEMVGTPAHTVAGVAAAVDNSPYCEP